MTMLDVPPTIIEAEAVRDFLDAELLDGEHVQSVAITRYHGNPAVTVTVTEPDVALPHIPAELAHVPVLFTMMCHTDIEFENGDG